MPFKLSSLILSIDPSFSIATKTRDGYDSFVSGTALPMDDIVTFNFELLNVGNYSQIMVGVASAAITSRTDRSDIYDKCGGWYLYCHTTKLYSGPPTNYYGKEYGNKGQLRVNRVVGVTVNRSSEGIFFVVKISKKYRK